MLSFPRSYSPNLWVAPILFFFLTITRHSLLLSQFLCTSSCIVHVRIPFTTSWICSLLFQIQILGHTPLESIQLRYISFSLCTKVYRQFLSRNFYFPQRGFLSFSYTSSQHPQQPHVRLYTGSEFLFTPR